MTRTVKKRRTATGHVVTARDEEEIDLSTKRKVTAQPTRRSKRLAEKERRKQAAEAAQQQQEAQRQREEQEQKERQEEDDDDDERRRRIVHSSHSTNESSSLHQDDCSISSMGSSSSSSESSNSDASFAACEIRPAIAPVPSHNKPMNPPRTFMTTTNKNVIGGAGAPPIRPPLGGLSFGSHSSRNRPLFRAPPVPIVAPPPREPKRKKKTKEYREIVEISSDSDSSSRRDDDMAIDSDASTPGPSYMCDEKGYIVFREGLKINNRFRLIRQLGKGTFSRVFEATDKKEPLKRKALKVIRAVDKYRAAARTELRVLTAIRESDPNAQACCVRLLEDTYYNEHPIFVFNLLGRSLYSFLVDNNYHAYKLEHVRHFAQQIVRAVAYVHSLQIIITDLKPENIVFVNDQSVQEIDETGRKYNVPVDTRIRLIDFGSAVFDNSGVHTHLIQTRHYRAPEVVLQSNWSYSADIWSIGCILVELIVGRMLFNTHDSIDHLSQMEKCLGQRVPNHITENLPDEQWHQFFTGDGYEENIIAVQRAKRSPFQCTRLSSYFRPEQHQLQHLVELMLKWDPDDRVTAKSAQRHPFVAPHLQLRASGSSSSLHSSSSSNPSGLVSSRSAYFSNSHFSGVPATASSRRTYPLSGASRSAPTGRAGFPTFITS